MVQIEISQFLADLCVVRKSHWVPDKGQEAKMNELEEIQSRTCFNQRLDIFFSFGSGAAILLDALNRKRQAVGRRPSVVIQGRSQLSQESARRKERLGGSPSARSANQRTHTQGSWRQRGIRGEKGNPIVYLTFSPRLAFVNCLVCLLSLLSFFLLSHFRLLFLSSGFLFLGSAASQRSLADLSLSSWVASLSFPSPSPPSSPEVSQP